MKTLTFDVKRMIGTTWQHAVREKKRNFCKRGTCLFRNHGRYDMAEKYLRQSMYARVEEARSQWIMDDSEIRVCVCPLLMVIQSQVNGHHRVIKNKQIEPFLD